MLVSGRNCPLSFSLVCFGPLLNRLEIGLADEVLTWLQIVDARVVPLFGTTGVTNLGILDNDSPSSGDWTKRCHQTANDGGLGATVLKNKTGRP